MKKKLLIIMAGIFLSLGVLFGMTPSVFAEDSYYPDTEMEMVDPEGTEEPETESGSQGGSGSGGKGDSGKGTDAKTSDANRSLIWWVLGGLATCGIAAAGIVYSKKSSRKEK